MNEGMDEYITKPIETSELLYILNKFLSHKAKKEDEDKKDNNKKQEITNKSKTDVIESIEEKDVVETSNKETKKEILIAKKFQIEARVLSKIIDNLGYSYINLADVKSLKTELESGKYDIVFADKDLIDDEMRASYKNIAIITEATSKEKIEEVIKQYRG
jgi:DNA-binding NtrC family response regulator